VTGAALIETMRRHGRDFFTGVPDSVLRSAFAHLGTSCDYSPAVAEPSAVGLAFGAWLAGRRPVVLMQNSGLALSTNAFATLVMLYRAQILLVVGWRGFSADDSSEHRLLGRTVLDLLSLLDIAAYPVERESIAETISYAVESMELRNGPAALVVPPNVVS
jgi:sulfopyruvate decarboxylase TPP-binding subunit